MSIWQAFTVTYGAPFNIYVFLCNALTAHYTEYKRPTSQVFKFSQPFLHICITYVALSNISFTVEQLDIKDYIHP